LIGVPAAHPGGGGAGRHRRRRRAGGPAVVGPAPRVGRPRRVDPVRRGPARRSGAPAPHRGGHRRPDLAGGGPGARLGGVRTRRREGGSPAGADARRLAYAVALGCADARRRRRRFERALRPAPRVDRARWQPAPGLVRAVRLAAVAPFAHWSPPTPRLLQSGLVWESDGLLLGGFFPASARIPWGGATISMVRPALLGVVNARTGGVRIFRDDPADSLAAAWARITDPLIEPPSAVPAELRSFRSYPDELLLAQARALEGPAWHAGRLDRSGGDSGEAMLPAAPGG